MREDIGPGLLRSIDFGVVLDGERLIKSPVVTKLCGPAYLPDAISLNRLLNLSIVLDK